MGLSKAELAVNILRYRLQSTGRPFQPVVFVLKAEDDSVSMWTVSSRGVEEGKTDSTALVLTCPDECLLAMVNGGEVRLDQLEAEGDLRRLRGLIDALQSPESLLEIRRGNNEENQ